MPAGDVPIAAQQPSHFLCRTRPPVGLKAATALAVIVPLAPEYPGAFLRGDRLIAGPQSRDRTSAKRSRTRPENSLGTGAERSLRELHLSEAALDLLVVAIFTRLDAALSRGVVGIGPAPDIEP